MSSSFPLLPVLLACAFAMSAHAAVLVRSASQLGREKAVGAMVQPYQAIAAANVILERCTADYRVTDEYKAFGAKLFADVSKQYTDAYRDAYMSYVGAEPDATMVQDYTNIISAQQQNAVKNMDGVITQRGCADPSVRHMLTYIEKLRTATSQPGSQ